MYGWFFRGASIDSFAFEECDSFGIRTYFARIRHAYGNRNSFFYLTFQNRDNLWITEIFRIQKYGFLAAREQRLDFCATINGREDEIAGTFHDLVSRKICSKYIEQSLHVFGILPDYVKFPIACETRITEISGCDNIGIIHDKSLGMRVGVEFIIRIRNGYSGVFQFIECFCIDTGTAKYVFLEDDLYSNPSFMGIFQGCNNSFLCKNIGLDLDANFGCFDHSNDPIQYFFIRSRQYFHIPSFDFLDGKTLPSFD